MLELGKPAIGPIKGLSLAALLLALVIFAGCDTGSSLADDDTGFQFNPNQEDTVTDLGLPDNTEPMEDLEPQDTCTPSCDGLLCGDDGCGGSCGDCPRGDCVQGQCICTPDCGDHTCGDNGCGGSCGDCTGGFECDGYYCVEISGPCAGVECGQDGNGNFCGDCPCPTCAEGASVCEDGICVTPSGNATCSQIVDCMNGCTSGTEACIMACFYSGTPTAQTQLQAMITCFDANGYYQCTTEDCMVNVMEQYCKPQSDTCFGNTNPGTLNCTGIVDCLNICGDGDDACVQNCFDNGTPQAQTQLQNLISCLDGAGYFNCSTDQCMNDIMNGVCANQAQSCFGGSGQLDCEGLVVCTNGCANGDDACIEACFGQATTAAQTQLTNLVDCLDQNGYFNCSTEQCMDDIMYGQCPSYADACFTGEGQGLTCEEIVICTNNCGENDACLQACFDAGSDAGVALLQTLLTCLDGNGYFSCTTTQCQDNIMYGVCSQNANACFVSEGGDSCSEILDCVNNCLNLGDACDQACLDAGSYEGQTYFASMYTCLEDNGYFNCSTDQCMTAIENGPCASSISACFSN